MPITEDDITDIQNKCICMRQSIFKRYFEVLTLDDSLSYKHPGLIYMDENIIGFVEETCVYFMRHPSRAGLIFFMGCSGVSVDFGVSKNIWYGYDLGEFNNCTINKRKITSANRSDCSFFVYGTKIMMAK